MRFGRNNPFFRDSVSKKIIIPVLVAQWIERFLAEEEAAGSNPVEDTMLSLSSPIEEISKIGPAYLKKLHRLKIKTVRDLFLHFPHRYDDFSHFTSINQLQINQTVTVQGKVAKINSTPRNQWRKISITEALIEDGTGTIKAVWFNQPYLTQTLKLGVKINLSGKIARVKTAFSFSNPAYEIINKQDFTHTGRLVPIYHETAGLSSRYLRYIIKPLLYLTETADDFLPEEIKKEFGLGNLNQSIQQIHFPSDALSAQKARRRLAFNELFLIQLNTLRQKKELDKKRATVISFNQKLIKSFVKKLPFKLTDDQRIAAWEIFQDIGKNKPMNRLLDGDVGSGKTITALMTALQTAKVGYQTALMAPTEILARQHFQTFQNFLKEQDLNIALLTSSESVINDTKKIARVKLKKQIAEGKVGIIIGTHSLIQESVFFKNLALAIVDEQHRFGVAQRAALQKNIYEMKDGLPTIPHLLSMTATPIPRTLALTIYGDLDISLIKEMPKGRQKVITKIVAPAGHQKTYDFIKNQIEQKKQVFVICPLIEKLDEEIKSVTKEYKKLSEEIFPHFNVAMLHGKLKPKEKETIMKEFSEGIIDILVSTSVVEVGVDVPNATVMLIEGAERFGLAQLHQFRGRIGRGDAQSYCFIATSHKNAKVSGRLKAIVKCHNGFELAEKDLKLRGPGDFTGVRQWGLPDLVMASLNDLELVKQTRQAAKTILEKNFLTPPIKKELKKFQTALHLE